MKPESIEGKKWRRKKQAIQGVAMFAVFQVAMAVGMVAMCFIPDAPWWAVALLVTLAGLCVGMIVPAIIILKQRFREIEGGELDAASEY